MTRAVVPIRSLATRLPDAGRIRIGIKVPTSNGKSRPEKLRQFRFTSQDRTAVDQVAAIYGGEVKPWSDPKAAKGQFEVVTTSTEIRIALPPDPLGGTPIYEMWSGGGCQRRCDGETCEMLTNGQDGLELNQVDCLCAAKGEMTCSVMTRLSVLLPEIRFVGVWRIDTKSWNAAQELPGMVELIRGLQDKGIVRGLLRVEWRRQVLAGQTREFAVPTLGIDETLNELAAGHARMGALAQASAPVAEIGAGNGPGEGPAQEGSVDGVEPVRDAEPAPAPDPDDEIVDAELVDDDRSELDALADTTPKRSKALKAAVVAAQHAGLPIPEGFDQITDPRLIGVAVQAIGGQP